MFQAVLAGCILINFFIYDPLLYFLKKLAGAKNLLDLHALGRVSSVRYMQQRIKMKWSQSLQNGQTPTRVVPGSWPALWVTSGPSSCTGSQVPDELACCCHCLRARLLRGASGDPGGRWWSWVLWWPRWTVALPGEEACSSGGASRALLSFPSYPQRPLNSTSLSLPSGSLGSMSEGCASFCLCSVHRRGACLANKTANS